MIDAPAKAPGPRTAAVEPASATPRLAVTIVAWKGADLTIDCLRSVEPEVRDLRNCHVYVVDNASPDDSADRVERAIADNGWGEWVTFIRAPTNGGFAAGNNIAIRIELAAVPTPKYVLLLNPDTVVRRGAFRLLLNFMERHPHIGIGGGRSEDPDTTPQHCCFRFPNILSEMAGYLKVGIVDRLLRRHLVVFDIPREPCPVDWIAGAFMMIRREVFEAVGLMDEGYFLYYEETDFILRARRAGWPCWHVPESRIIHLVGQSSGVTKRTDKPARLPAYWFESRRRYFILNHGRLYAACTDLLVLLSLATTPFRQLIQRGRTPQPPRFVRDFLRHSAMFKGRRTLKPRATAP